jgi:hypothetical protein
MTETIRRNATTGRFEPADARNPRDIADARVANATVQVMGVHPSRGIPLIATGTMFEEDGKRYIVTSAHAVSDDGKPAMFPLRGGHYIPIFDGEGMRFARVVAMNPSQGGCERQFLSTDHFVDVAVFEFLSVQESNSILSEIMTGRPPADQLRRGERPIPQDTIAGKTYADLLRQMVNANRRTPENTGTGRNAPRGVAPNPGTGGDTLRGVLPEDNITEAQLRALAGRVDITPISLDGALRPAGIPPHVRMISAQTNRPEVGYATEIMPLKYDWSIDNNLRGRTTMDEAEYLRLSNISATIRRGYSGSLVYAYTSDGDVIPVGMFTGIEDRPRDGLATPIGFVDEGIDAAQGERGIVVSMERLGEICPTPDPRRWAVPSNNALPAPR